MGESACSTLDPEVELEPSDPDPLPWSWGQGLETTPLPPFLPVPPLPPHRLPNPQLRALHGSRRALGVLALPLSSWAGPVTPVNHNFLTCKVQFIISGPESSCENLK